jgi:hypothetical protein
MVLRVVAPGKSMLNYTDKEVPPQPIPGAKHIDHRLFTDSEKYGHFNHHAGAIHSYIDEIWHYYGDNTLLIGDIAGIPYELEPNEPKDEDLKYSPGSVCEGKVVGVNFKFTCKDEQTGNIGKEKVLIPKQSTSLPFFAGAVGDFDAPNDTLKSIIVRNLSAAVVAGLLPARSGNVIDHEFFKQNKGNFYTNTKYDENNGNGVQYYDLYAKALHSFGDGQFVYAFAYDDVLGQDGTLHYPNYLGALAPLQITLGKLDVNYEDLPDKQPGDPTDPTDPPKGVCNQEQPCTVTVYYPASSKYGKAYKNNSSEVLQNAISYQGVYSLKLDNAELPLVIGHSKQLVGVLIEQGAAANELKIHLPSAS